MRLSRRTHAFAALLALVSLLFTQLAVAGYACPSMQIAQAMETIAASAVQRDMPGCPGMNTEDTVLCQNQGQTGNQSLDKPALPDVSPFVASLLTQTLNRTDSLQPSLVTPSAAFVLMRSTAPPLSIRNCCFRI
jgi:hypothetical protein